MRNVIESKLIYLRREYQIYFDWIIFENYFVVCLQVVYRIILFNSASEGMDYSFSIPFSNMVAMEISVFDDIICDSDL